MEQISNTIRSQVLIDALPYIQRYNNKIVVIKYGGNAMTNGELKQAVMSDIVLLTLVGVKVVLVHDRQGPPYEYYERLLQQIFLPSQMVNHHKRFLAHNLL